MTNSITVFYSIIISNINFSMNIVIIELKSCPLPPIIEAVINKAIMQTKTLRSPKERIAQLLAKSPELIAAKNAVAIHCAKSWPMPNAPIISGTATLIMVDDIARAILDIIQVSTMRYPRVRSLIV